MITCHFPNIEPRKRSLAIGVFDGVHRGHQKVIEGNDAVLTFDPHPLSILKPSSTPEMITTLKERLSLFAKLGVQETIILPFNQQYAQMPASEFVESVLIQNLQAQKVTVGENFRFGRGAQGDVKTLSDSSSFVTESIPLNLAEGEVVVSSTRIRNAIKNGDIKTANTMLGRYWSVTGTVIRGDQRGRELGFPTANIELPQGIVCPRFGIYAGLVNKNLIPAAISVGVRPTFETAGKPLIEVHLLDFSQDLYGQEITVQFVEFLRDEEKFNSVDALIAQMRADVERVERILEEIILELIQ